jgi:two-component system, NarL family, response regulator NreC
MWEIVGETDDGRDAVRLADDLKPDIAIIDIGTPSIKGIETTRRIAEQSPQTYILVLGSHPDDVYVSLVQRAGGRGYLLKDSADSYLHHAVTALSHGKYFFLNRESTGTF